MSLILPPINFVLRHFVKPKIARTRSVEMARLAMEKRTRWLTRLSADFNFSRDRFPTEDGKRYAYWISRGKFDRRRLVLYLHGGAYIMGSARTHAALCAELSKSSGARVFCPEYRLAPENPFPAALDDALAAYRHLLSLAYQPQQIGLAGDSAGGGLALALLLKLQKLKIAQPAALALFSPWVDLTMSGASVRENEAKDNLLPAKRAAEVVEYYVQEHAPDNPFISPLFGKFERPPPVMISVSQKEILRDDTMRIAQILSEAGGDIRLETHQTAPHAWPFFLPLLPEGTATVRQAGHFFCNCWSKTDE